MTMKATTTPHKAINTSRMQSSLPTPKIGSTDVNTLLESIDSFSGVKSILTNNTSSSSTPQTTALGENTHTKIEFDPIDFLNHHYQTEASLVSSLPTLRSTLSTRISHLNDSIANTIQKQADLADTTLSDVSRAKGAIAQLHQRIVTVQQKACLSERAVQEITRDMKRLDYAKKHLSKTITALKRLHMLLHAVMQLQYCVRVTKPYPDYKSAANLIDATQLLLGHFKGYMLNVEPMRLMKQDVDTMMEELQEGVVFGFRVVGFGHTIALEKKIQSQKTATHKRNNGKQNHKLNTINTLEGEDDENTTIIPVPPMPSHILTNACHALDALGPQARTNFLNIFCTDHLEQYDLLFNPKNNTSASGGGSTGAQQQQQQQQLLQQQQQQQKQSFKILKNQTDFTQLIDGGGKEMSAASANPNQGSLDQVERRYAWYRRMLRQLEDKFPSVFPRSWNVHYCMTLAFLTKTGEHFSLLFSAKDSMDKHFRDRDCENVTILLKALQKTILFEKEMTAWLQREYGTVFLDPKEGDAKNKANHILGDDGEILEFDDHGKAVAASSAEGIRIKYERQLKERRKKEQQQATINQGDMIGESMSDLEFLDPNKGTSQHDSAPNSVPPLIGVASNSFDKHMGPYIALEEQNMDEQLVESTSDSTVDTRGELPVYTSSTSLFVYIKNSITRCTVLTRGKTLYLLYQAYQDTLRKYAQVLGGKFPQPITGPAAAIGNINIALQGAVGGGVSASTSTNASYKIPPGEEKTVCYVIDTCEYCSDTVEALQDLIADKIEDEYKSLINMSGEQAAFHDITAKGVRVLVSGLVVRTEPAFREMSAINWSSVNVVGEESNYVRSMHDAIQPFVVTIKRLLPNSYFRSFCDKFASLLTTNFYNAIIRCKRISESGTQQLLLDVYNIKNLLLKLPVIESRKKTGSNNTSTTTTPTSQATAAGSTIAPAIYTKMITKQIQRIETLLKLVGTPSEVLIDVFKVQWQAGSALDLQTVMNLKGMKRNEQAIMLEKFGVDPATAMRGATVGTSNTLSAVGGLGVDIQSLQDKSSDVAAKVNSDLNQMRQKVEDFRKAHLLQR